MVVSSINDQLNTNYEHLSIMKIFNTSSDDAITIGVSSIVLDDAYDNSQYTKLDFTSTRSHIEDLDIPSYVVAMNNNRILNDYRMFVQSSKTEQAAIGISILLRDCS
ncbi:hypothetical protein [Anaerosporobacter sp.]